MLMRVVGGIKIDNGTPTGVPLQKTGSNNIGALNGLSAEFIKDLQTLDTFTNTAGTQLIGSTLSTVTFNWTYNRNSDNPSSQQIEGFDAIDTSLRTITLEDLNITSNTTFTLNAVGDDVNWGASEGNESSRTTSIAFRNLRYWGVSQDILDDETSHEDLIEALVNTEFAMTKATTKNINASVNGGNNYVYVLQPASLGTPTVYVGGFEVAPIITNIVDLANDEGYEETYLLIMLPSPTSDASVSVVLV